MSKCGQCKQFIKNPENQKALCGAWNQPSTATSSACNFFFPEMPTRRDHAVDQNQESN